MFHKMLSIVGGVALALMLGRAWHFRAWRMAGGPHGTYRRRPFGHWHKDWDEAAAAEAPASDATSEQ